MVQRYLEDLVRGLAQRQRHVVAHAKQLAKCYAVAIHTTSRNLTHNVPHRVLVVGREQHSHVLLEARDGVS